MITLIIMYKVKVSYLSLTCHPFVYCARRFLADPRRSKSGWVCIETGGGFAIGMPGGFEVGISGGFDRNTHHFSNSDNSQLPD